MSCIPKTLREGFAIHSAKECNKQKRHEVRSPGKLLHLASKAIPIEEIRVLADDLY